MGKPIKFKLYKYSVGCRYKETFNFKPRAKIIFQGEVIGTILDRDVYFFIKINHKDDEPNEIKCLNYVSELWRTFPTHQEAKDTVMQQADHIWNTLNICHTLKK